MTTMETTIINMCESLTSREIESIISELQIQADRKYTEEEIDNIE